MAREWGKGLHEERETSTYHVRPVISFAATFGLTLSYQCSNEFQETSVEITF
jgi:hypothetical protein